MAFSLHHIHLKHFDPKATADWYAAAFGFEIVIDVVRPTGDRLIRMALGANQPPFLIITDPVPGQDLPQANAGQTLGLEHFALATDDLKADLKRLATLGAKLVDGPTTLADGMAIAFIETPGQVRIELLQLP